MLGINNRENWLAGLSPPPQETFLPMDAPRHLHAQLLYDHWSKRKDSFIIGRDIPSRALAPVLRNVAVLEGNRDHSDFHVRLAGTAWLRQKASASCSVMTFVAPYGDNGRSGASSATGYESWFPYTEEDEAYTNARSS